MEFRRVLFRSRPLGLDALVGDAGVVRPSTSRRAPQLVEHLAGRLVREVLALAEPLRDLVEDPHVGLGLARRVERLVDLAHQRVAVGDDALALGRSEEHTSELQSLMRTSYAFFCLKKKHTKTKH